MKKDIQTQHEALVEHLCGTLVGLSKSFNRVSDSILMFGESKSMNILPLGKDRFNLKVYHSGKDSDHYETLVFNTIDHRGESAELFRTFPTNNSDEYMFEMSFYSRKFRGTPVGCVLQMLRLAHISVEQPATV